MSDKEKELEGKAKSGKRWYLGCLPMVIGGVLLGGVYQMGRNAGSGSVESSPPMAEVPVVKHQRIPLPGERVPAARSAPSLRPIPSISSEPVEPVERYPFRPLHEGMETEGAVKPSELGLMPLRSLESSSDRPAVESIGKPTAKPVFSLDCDCGQEH